MAGVNKVILVGNLGQKPEIRYTSSGIPVANFTLATTERWGKDESGQNKEHTEWHRIVAWRKLAEICGQYLDKGTKIYCEGSLRTSSWQTPEGEKRFKTEIQMDQMVILSSRGERGEVPSGSYDQEYGPAAGNGGGGNDRGGGAFRKESGGSSTSFPGNNGGRTATESQAPEVINLDSLDDDQFF